MQLKERRGPRTPGPQCQLDTQGSMKGRKAEQRRSMDTKGGVPVVPLKSSSSSSARQLLPVSDIWGRLNKVDSEKCLLEFRLLGGLW